LPDALMGERGHSARSGRHVAGRLGGREVSAQFQPDASARNRFVAECREQRVKCSRSRCL
jgi:hypothetical protein